FQAHFLFFILSFYSIVLPLMLSSITHCSFLQVSFSRTSFNQSSFTTRQRPLPRHFLSHTSESIFISHIFHFQETSS
ncbi:hypothetical protein VIGAN_06110100, partial [Vigna angularis var. angularis]